jgi:hypothetical protein
VILDLLLGLVRRSDRRSLVVEIRVIDAGFSVGVKDDFLSSRSDECDDLEDKP